MTAQIPERLLHRGNTLALAADPLRDYLQRLKKDRRPDFVWTSTACWRGYVGTWEFRDGFLCLVGLSGAIRVGGQVVEADLPTAFPSARGCLRATWLTALLRCPEGRLVQYAHHSFASTYERDRLFGIQNGKMIEEFVEVHPPPSLLYRIDDLGNRQRIEHLRSAEAMDDPLEGRPLSDAHLVWGREPEGKPDAGYFIAGWVTRRVKT